MEQIGFLHLSASRSGGAGTTLARATSVSTCYFAGRHSLALLVPQAMQSHMSMVSACWAQANVPGLLKDCIKSVLYRIKNIQMVVSHLAEEGQSKPVSVCEIPSAYPLC